MCVQSVVVIWLLSTDVLSSRRFHQVLRALCNLRGVVARATAATVVRIYTLVEGIEQSRGLLHYVLAPGQVVNVGVGVGVVESRAMVPVGFAAIFQG